MRLSIIIPVLDSHEMVRRQLLHCERIGLPPDSELILVDDGSDPPIANTSRLPVRIHRTRDTRPWTWPLARNAGARIAKGEYLLMIDLDHIITRKLLDYVVNFDGPRTQFKRKFGILDENGVLKKDRESLESYGLLPGMKLRVESHHNSFAMRRDLYWQLGGYVEDRIGLPYPQGEDSIFWDRWNAYMVEHGLEMPKHPPILYVVPTSRWCGDVDYNPHGLFHNLTRKTPHNYWWNRQRKYGLEG